MKKIQKELKVVEEEIVTLLEIENINELKNKLFDIKLKFNKETNIDLFEYEDELKESNKVFDISEERRIDSNIYH